ncbi:single-stranded-DNA-specific exonuclease RecJ [Candidatus Zinderia endosymbiont of Aphrophora alni]|uniref:single-stranded-DNA-specific exonuclease RecJ n=1 Tax=Candidatus Zinderia endosymbiont of Aphrophora alni TaxID=3077951 RepID=UPI0030CE4FC2
MTQIVSSFYKKNIVKKLIFQGVNPILARIFCIRGIKSLKDIHYNFNSLLLPSLLLNSNKAAVLLANTINLKKKILIFADYDCDGISACALCYRVLRIFGALNIEYFIPNRFKNGYGFTLETVKFILKTKSPDLIITVDNGISNIEGVSYAIKKNIKVIITDHHLPKEKLPQKCIIVNPNQPLCNFPSKNLSGVGVIFYVLWSLQKELLKRGIFNKENKPKLTNFLDLVALGTIADSVKLDFNNRILVSKGLKIIRSGKANLGINSLFLISKKSYFLANVNDLSFLIIPKINSLGRLHDVSLGIKCLILNNKKKILKIVKRINELNNYRKHIENSMYNLILKLIKNINLQKHKTITIYNDLFNEGLIGIFSSRLRDKFYKPVIIFAKSFNNFLKGSGRSVAGFNLYNVLVLISKKNPFLIKNFGGHFMAVGLTIHKDNFLLFKNEFELLGKLLINNYNNNKIINTDGKISSKYYSIKFFNLINNYVWGEQFPYPIFYDYFKVIYQKILKKKHLKILLEKKNIKYHAIWFNHNKKINNYALIAFKLICNYYYNTKKINLLIEYAYSL